MLCFLFINTNYICKNIEKVVETHVYIITLRCVIIFVWTPLIKIAGSAIGCGLVATID
jgi:hypothetical protein